MMLCLLNTNISTLLMNGRSIQLLERNINAYKNQLSGLEVKLSQAPMWST